MDVKFGSGAFMRDIDDARALADSLVLVANGAGLPTSALLTDMNQPLASAAGNALEVAYVVDYLTGARREPRFHAATVALGAEMLVLGRLATDRAAAEAAVEDAIASGAAAERFSRMVAALGGPGDLLQHPQRHLPRAPIRRAVHPGSPGLVAAIATRERRPCRGRARRRAQAPGGPDRSCGRLQRSCRYRRARRSGAAARLRARPHRG